MQRTLRSVGTGLDYDAQQRSDEADLVIRLIATSCGLKRLLRLVLLEVRVLAVRVSSELGVWHRQGA